MFASSLFYYFFLFFVSVRHIYILIRSLFMQFIFFDIFNSTVLSIRTLKQGQSPSQCSIEFHKYFYRCGAHTVLIICFVFHIHINPYEFPSFVTHCFISFSFLIFIFFSHQIRNAMKFYGFARTLSLFILLLLFPLICVGTSLEHNQMFHSLLHFDCMQSMQLCVQFSRSFFFLNMLFSRNSNPLVNYEIYGRD